MRVKTLLIGTVAGVLILAGVLVGTVRLVDMLAPGYRTQIAARLSARIHQPVTVGKLDLSWDWRGPVLRLEQVTLAADDGGQPAVAVRAVALHFAFTDLLRGQLDPTGISLIRPRLGVTRTPDGRLRIAGLASNPGAFDPTAVARALDRLRFLRIEDGVLRWQGNTHGLGPLNLHAVQLSLRNHASGHRLQAQAALPAALGGRITADAFIQGNPEQLAQARGNGYVHATSLAGARLLRAAGLGAPGLTGGITELQLWGDWRGLQLHDARLQLTSTALKRSSEGATLQAPVAVAASAQATDAGYRITLDKLDNSNAAGNVTWTRADDRLQGQFQHLPASFLLGLAKLLAPQRLAGWQASGDLAHLQFDTAGGLQVNGSYQALALRKHTDKVRLGQLGGQFALTRDHGSLHLRQADGTLAWPRYLRGSLPLDTLAGDIDWQRHDGGWQIQASKLQFASIGAQVSGGGSITLPQQGAPQVDLSLQAAAQDAARIMAHLPQAEDLPNPRLRDWLPKAIRAGRIDHAQVQLQGDLARFPFAQGNGRFHVGAAVSGVNLHYKPGWPALTGGRGSLTLDGDTLHIEGQQAQMLGVDIGPSQADVADIREPVLKLQGRVNNASAAAMLKFLPASPLADKFGKLSQAIQVAGRAGLTLALSVPLKPGLGEISVDGRLQLADTSLDHDILPDPISHIHGLVRFDRKGLYAQDLAGDMHGLPVSADLTPGGDGALDITAQAGIALPRDRATLAKFVPDPIVAHASGKTDWTVSLQVTPKGKVSSLRLHSDLRGLALDMPAPIGKAAAATVPTQVRLAANHGPIQVNMKDRMDLRLRAQDGHLAALNLEFGGGDAQPVSAPGVWLGGHLKQADIDAWQAFLSDFRNHDNTQPQRPGIQLRGANLQLDQVRYKRLLLNDVHANVQPLTSAQGYTATLAGAGAQGQVRWLSNPDERPQLSAQFSHLMVKTTAAADARKADTQSTADNARMNPNTLPQVQAHSDKVTIDGDDFGHWDIAVEPLEAGLALRQLSIAGGVFQASASGNWTQANNHSRAALQFKASGSGLDALIQAAGYAPTVRAQDANITGKLNITPNTKGLDPSALDGSLSLKMKKGSLLTVDSNASRVLGLFNLYVLPRRLQLNFSDVLDKGMAFDNVNGDFAIKNGRAETRNLHIDTSSAKIRIKGTIDLGAQTYDEHVTVVPELSSGVAIAGTVLGGPAVGAALLVAQKLLEKPIKKISSISYHLTGNWHNPQIDKVNAKE